jgi:hypothetical protein
MRLGSLGCSSTWYSRRAVWAAEAQEPCCAPLAPLLLTLHGLRSALVRADL